jgi:hypothetical protein
MIAADQMAVVSPVRNRGLSVLLVVGVLILAASTLLSHGLIRSVVAISTLNAMLAAPLVIAWRVQVGGVTNVRMWIEVAGLSVLSVALLAATVGELRIAIVGEHLSVPSNLADWGWEIVRRAWVLSAIGCVLTGAGAGRSRRLGLSSGFLLWLLLLAAGLS